MCFLCALSSYPQAPRNHRFGELRKEKRGERGRILRLANRNNDFEKHHENQIPTDLCHLYQKLE